MPDYPLYLLDRHDKIHAHLEMECGDDDHAIELVNEHLAGAAMELWCGPRLVRRFTAKST